MAIPSRFSLQLKDNSGKLIKILNKKVSNLSWAWDRVGGCGSGNLTLNGDRSFLNNIGPDYEINIFLKGVLRYSGVVVSHKPVEANGFSVSLNFIGYSTQIKRNRVQKTYEFETLTDILTDILDTFIVPNTDITYDANDIDQFNFVPDILDLNTDGGNAIATLAGLAGSVEYGVDADKKFFFRRTSDVVGFQLKYTMELSKVDIINDYSGIVNRLFIVGKDGFEDTADNTESQDSFGLRTQTISVSSISTTSVAQQFGTSTLLQKAGINQKATFVVQKDERFFEQVLPLQKVTLISKNVPDSKRYGDDDSIYGEFNYGGDAVYQINKINYKLSSQGSQVSINAGFKRPDLAEEIKRIQFEIDQIRVS